MAWTGTAPTSTLAAGAAPPSSTVGRFYIVYFESNPPVEGVTNPSPPRLQMSYVDDRCAEALVDVESPVGYFRCLPTSFVISNMFTAALPPKTVFSAASALIMRLFLGSWSLFFLM